jgi:hypothetical protein
MIIKQQDNDSPVQSIFELNSMNIINRDTNLTLPFLAHGHYWYTTKYFLFLDNVLVTSMIGFQGNNFKPEFQSSDAYYFQPLTSDPLPVSNSRNI